MIARAALGYVNTPWHHQGRLKDVGVDCVGLLVLAGNEAGASIEDVTNYPPQFSGTWLTDELSKYCDRLENKSGPYEVGDVLVFAFAEGYWHVVIVTELEPLRIVHAYTGVGYCVEGPVSQAWLRRLHSAWRVR